jgi:hypothetical protein
MSIDCIRGCRRIHVRVQIRVGIEVHVGIGTSVVSHVVDVEAADVRKEVLVGEGVIGQRDTVSSRAETLPKNLIAPHPYRFTRGGVLEAYCPVVRCMPEEGMEKVQRRRKALEARYGI